MATGVIEQGDELAFMDGVRQAELVRAGEVSALELVEAAIGRVERVNPRLNAVVIEMFDIALEAARGPVPRGPFSGVPYVLAGCRGDPSTAT